jgi:hypothetical protein
MLANGVVNAIGIIWNSHCNALSINDKQNHNAFKAYNDRLLMKSETIPHKAKALQQLV